MITLIVFLAGIMFGSFINAFVWRLHKKKNWVSERSICPHCKHVLAPKDLVPVLSWLALRGKCRYCKKPIEDTPLVELLTGALFAVSYIFWPFDWSVLGWLAFISWLACLVLLISLLIYDLKWMLLPNKLVIAATVTGIINIGFIAGIQGASYVLGALAGGAIIVGLFWLLFEVSKGKWIGGGDVKLAFILGALAGTPYRAVLLVFIASVLGTIVSLPLLASKKLKATAKIPFGPFLIAATIIVYLFGQTILDWYIHTFLYL